MHSPWQIGGCMKQQDLTFYDRHFIALYLIALNLNIAVNLILNKIFNKARNGKCKQTG